MMYAPIERSKDQGRELLRRWRKIAGDGRSKNKQCLMCDNANNLVQLTHASYGGPHARWGAKHRANLQCRFEVRAPGGPPRASLTFSDLPRGHSPKIKLA